MTRPPIPPPVSWATAEASGAAMHTSHGTTRHVRIIVLHQDPPDLDSREFHDNTMAGDREKRLLALTPRRYLARVRHAGKG
jgi:hypothetical protein